MREIEEKTFRVRHLELLLEAVIARAGLIKAEVTDCRAERNRVAFRMGGHSYRLFVTQYEDDVFGETVTYLLFDETNALLARASSKLYHFEIDGRRFEQLVPEELSCELCTGGCPDCLKLRQQ